MDEVERLHFYSHMVEASPSLRMSGAHNESQEIGYSCVSGHILGPASGACPGVGLCSSCFHITEQRQKSTPASCDSHMTGHC